MDDWRTIESAPKDGTTIDLWGVGGRYADAAWLKGGWRILDLDGFDNLDYVRLECVVTHWMPIPNGPAIKGGE